MKKYLRWSTLLFSISSIAFGLIAIIFGDFYKGLLPVPAFVPGRMLLAYISGFILVMLGTGTLVKRWGTIASFYLGIVWMVFLVILHLGLLFTDIYNPGEWTATFEDPVYFSKPWSITRTFTRFDDNKDRIMPYTCTENNRDVDHLKPNQPNLNYKYEGN